MRLCPLIASSQTGPSWVSESFLLSPCGFPNYHPHGLSYPGTHKKGISNV